MQLAGPGVFGPPPDMDAAVLRESVAAGVANCSRNFTPYLRV